MRAQFITASEVAEIMGISRSFNKGYTAVFHGNGGTVNGQDIWISEVDRDKDSTYPYKYTDVNYTPVRAGYQFEGWYLDENFSQKFYGFQIPGGERNDG